MKRQCFTCNSTEDVQFIKRLGEFYCINCEEPEYELEIESDRDY